MGFKIPSFSANWGSTQCYLPTCKEFAVRGFGLPRESRIYYCDTHQTDADTYTQDAWREYRRQKMAVARHRPRDIHRDLGYRVSIQKLLTPIPDLLREREVQALVWLYGLDGGGQRSLTDLSYEWDVTRERARQIWNKALRKLGHPVRKRLVMDRVANYRAIRRKIRAEFSPQQ